MVTKSYRDYLKSPQWEFKRQQVFAHYGKRCYACGTVRGPIQVHHLDYANIFNAPITDLLPLCASCHREVERRYKRQRGARKRRLNRRVITYMYVKEKKAELEKPKTRRRNDRTKSALAPDRTRRTRRPR